MFNVFSKIYWIIFSTHQWYILYRQKNSTKWLKLKQPKNVSRADSFVVYESDKYYIFFEEFDIKERHGYLCVGELNQDTDSLDNIKIILEEDYHLSFPNIFKYKNKYYMVPESSENNTIDLYEFIVFPNELKKTRTLLKGNYADSILLNKDNLWYLFTNKSENNTDLNSKNLSIFISNDFINEEFKGYHQNPVIIDSEFARMGGQFIQKDNKLFRISQDCKTRYGYKINVMEVEILNKSQYKEILLKYIYPPDGYIAFHTLNSDNDIEVADGKVIVKNFKTIIHGIIKVIRLIIRKTYVK